MNTVIEKKKIETYELSYSQRTILLLEEIHPKTSINNIGGILKINSSIDINKLERAINIFIEKNEGMRLRIAKNHGNIYQYIKEYETEQIPYVDFSNCNNPQKEFENWSRKLFRIPFELENSSLYSFCIFKIRDNQGGVLLKIHHIICDGWGTSIMQRKVIEIYSRLLNDESVKLMPAPSFLEYKRKENRYVKSLDFIKDKKYWNDKFAHIPEEFLDRGSNDARGKRKTLYLKKDVCIRIKEYLNEKKIPINTFILIIMGLYINKKTHKEDIIIGNPIFNRPDKRDKDTFGMCISVMPVRMNIQEDKHLYDLINELSLEIKKDMQHQRYPYTLLLNDLNIRKRGYSSLYKYSINFYNTNYLNTLSNGCTLESNEYYSGCQSGHLRITIKEFTDMNFSINIDYLISKYTDDEAKEIQSYIRRIIPLIIEGSNIKIKDINY